MASLVQRSSRADGRRVAIPLRPRVPRASLRGQLSSMFEGSLDGGGIEFALLCGVFLCLFGSSTTVLVGVGTVLFGALLVMRGVAGGVAMLRYSWLLAYPALLILSTLWSPDPAVTARYSVQVLLTVMIGLYVGLFRTRADGLRIYFLTFAVLIVLSIVSGKQGASAEGAVLIGVFGSKNALALNAQSLAQAGMALALMRGRVSWRVLGALMTPIGIYFVLTSHAATSVISLAIGLVMLVGLRIGAMASRPYRLLIMVALIVLAGFMLPITDELSKLWQDFTFNVLHKDATLTGRTVLWDHARVFIRQRPWLGWGYKEAWLGSSGDTTGLLRWAGLLDARGFFFHHTWLEAEVDVGYVGLVVLALSWLVTAALLVGSYVFVKKADLPIEFALITFTIILLSSFSVTIIQPFSSQVALLGTVAVWAVMALREQRESEVALDVRS